MLGHRAGDCRQRERGRQRESTATPAESASPPDAGVAATPESAAAPEHPAEEPALIEVWRPGRSEGRRRPRDRRREPRRQAGTSAKAGARLPASRQWRASAEAQPSNEQAATSPPPKSGRPPRHHRRHGGEHRATIAGQPPGPQDRGERPQRERERPQARPARFERREREKAPGSKFARSPSSQRSRPNWRPTPRSGAECRPRSIASASIAGSGMPVSSAPAERRRHWRAPAMCA